MITNTKNAWVDWVNKEREKLTLQNYEDETLSCCSFEAGAEYMRQKAMVNFEDAIRKLKSRLPEDMQAMFSVTEEMIKFNKSLSE